MSDWPKVKIKIHRYINGIVVNISTVFKNEEHAVHGFIPNKETLTYSEIRNEKKRLKEVIKNSING